MKKIKLGLRLNAYNRRKIAQAVVHSQIGGRINSLNHKLADLGKEVYQALFDMYGLGNLCADGQDPSTIMEGTLPTAPHLTIVSHDRASVLNLDFGGVKPIPYRYQISNVNEALFDDLPMFEERVMGIFPMSALVEKQANEIAERMTKFLEGHKTLRTVIEEAPEIADIIPDEYCEEQAEGKSLDSILQGDAAVEDEDQGENEEQEGAA